MIYKLSLEQQVINALIRRKTGYLCNAVDSPEYRKAADKIKADVASYSLLAKNPEVSEAAQNLCDIINSANSDELNREEFAATLAYHTYNNPYDIESKVADMVGYSETFKNPLRESVRQKASTWKRLMERQYGLVLNIIENAMQFGIEGALSREGINNAVKTRYYSAKDYLEFETELQESIYAFSQLNTELAMHHEMEANKEMAEMYGDRMESPVPLFYLSLIAEKAASLAKILSLKAAELEANELFSK